MNPNTKPRPLPAPLPYSSQASRGEIPTPPAPDTAQPDHPDAPLLREDEATLLACGLFVLVFIVVMVAIAASGGL